MEVTTIDSKAYKDLSEKSEHNIDVPFRSGKSFLDPLYMDKHASCNIYYDRRGIPAGSAGSRRYDNKKGEY